MSMRAPLIKSGPENYFFEAHHETSKVSRIKFWCHTKSQVKVAFLRYSCTRRKRIVSPLLTGDAFDVQLVVLSTEWFPVW